MATTHRRAKSRTNPVDNPVPRSIAEAIGSLPSSKRAHLSTRVSRSTPHPSAGTGQTIVPMKLNVRTPFLAAPRLPPARIVTAASSRPSIRDRPAWLPPKLCLLWHLHAIALGRPTPTPASTQQLSRQLVPCLCVTTRFQTATLDPVQLASSISGL
ncbi:hypothetical protein CEP53_001677 [Fusarium sp. AF-6]|nr:hypothetical protein CEP53_001677 [Fusarium sp. AF-6]